MHACTSHMQCLRDPSHMLAMAPCMHAFVSMQVVQTSLQSQLDSLKRQHESEQVALEAQHLQGARALEDKLLQLRDQLHDKERQMAELHISHQVRQRSGTLRLTLSKGWHLPVLANCQLSILLAVIAS